MNERPKDLENRKTGDSCTMAPMQLPRTLDCGIKRVGLRHKAGHWISGHERTDPFLCLAAAEGRVPCRLPSRFEARAASYSEELSGQKRPLDRFLLGSVEGGRAGGREGLAKGCARSPTRVTQLLSILAGPPSQRRRPPRRPRRPKCCPCPPCRCSLSSHPKKVSFCALLPSLFLFTRL